MQGTAMQYHSYIDDIKKLSHWNLPPIFKVYLFFVNIIITEGTENVNTFCGNQYYILEIEMKIKYKTTIY
ncbi:hypothetical protein DWV06_04510 [Anaerosacchariphilus polymeriproducens]|uniref:Uncharacterized protein n=1 Tax=Anaerosacchariphilus polymeriproducens TaxID=1812858 RepID=A0A371AYV6_9FIRM|nr:hypothetical protein DWV06_04510 [Anaerosacchariphilus polymeriproducens]